MAGSKLREAGEAVGDPFDRAEPCWPCANGREKSRQHRGRRFVTPVTEEARQADAEHGAVEPGFVLG